MIRVNSQSFSLSSTLRKKNYDAHQAQQQHQQNIPNAHVHQNSVTSPYTSASKPSDQLGLQYVTERILASVLPARSRHNDNGEDREDRDDERSFDEDADVQLRRTPPQPPKPEGDLYERELVQMLEQKHGKNYKLFDLESCIATVTLERLCELCKHMDAWLGGGRDKVVVLQDRGNKQRLGVAIAAYLEYLDICATTTAAATSPATIARNWLNLDIFAMRKFLDDVIGPLRVPSHRRYLQYFAGLLSGQIKMNAAPLYLRYVSVDAPPTWLNYDAMMLATATGAAEWRTFVKVYEGLTCVFTSDIHVVPVSTRQFVFEVAGPLRLRGDVIVRCYHIVPSGRVYQERRELILSAQFHTCAITERTIAFGRAELDYACDDPRFPTDHQITLHFEKSAQSADAERSAGFLFQSPLVKIEPITTIAKYDSLENFDDASSQHTQGPLDGSLYATILKSPKTPERPSGTFAFPLAASNNGNGNNGNNNHSHRQSAALISPPPEFSNSDIATTSSSTPIRGAAHPHLQRSQSCTPGQPGVHGNNNTNNNNTIQRATYHQARPSSSQSHHYHNYQQQQRSVSRSSNYTSVSQPATNGNSTVGATSAAAAAIHNGHNNADAVHALERGQSIRYAQSTSGGEQRRASSAASSVHSPLTLSMDSGIASSGVTTHANRRVQGSSASPSSFPSQASPQEDRDRELDDILSDMLQTVKDIPDMAANINKPLKSSPTGTKNPQNLTIHLGAQQQPQTPSSYYQNTSVEYSSDTIKRSPKNMQQQQQQQQQLQHTSNAVGANYHDQFYETSSTTTTITPPASESGRDTPQDHSHHHHHHHQQQLSQQHQPHRSNSTLSLHSQRDTSADRSQYQNLTTAHHQQQQHHRQPHQPTPQQHHNTVQQSNGAVAASAADRESRTAATSTTTLQREHSQSHSFVYQPQTQQQQRCESSASTTAYSLVGPSSPPPPLSTTSTIDTDLDTDTDTHSQRSSHASSSTADRRQHQSIPYHAREDSRPFTYGHTGGHVQLQSVSEHPPPADGEQQHQHQQAANAASTGTGMLKMQSGLSSPSLVRRTLQPVAQPKAHVRNDFEEMLKLRREKVMQDTRDGGKYSIGDRATTPLASTGYGGGGHEQQHHVKWSTDGASNGYQYEPLKRSNTMDGGFGRSHSSDGSGQTWLQLQQQKLRAKKQLQTPGQIVTTTTTTTVHHPQHAATAQRPHRSRSSTARYDGYASDTAAFETAGFDEVDYRRPLHVQTPGGGGRSLHSTHSLTSSQTMLAHQPSERPFVAVKRAHAHQLHSNGVREESFSSYRSETDPETSLAGSPRPETPAFPVTPRTPYGLNGLPSPALPPKSPNTVRKDLYSGAQHNVHFVNQNDAASCYASRRNSNSSTATSEPQDVPSHLVKFVRDSSQFWYKPTITRDEAVALLRHAPPGTFIVRDSTTFAKAYGLVLKVAFPPAGIPARVAGPHSDELVRHFLVEPTTRGVRLKGCANEPVFTSLSALVYQHSITPLALPCRLLIADHESAYGGGGGLEALHSQQLHTPAQQQLLVQGAACNVLYLFTCDTESLTGPEAVRKAISLLFGRKPLPVPTTVHFKVAQQGVTLTDNTRQLFFRKHYPAANISHCGVDPEDRRWSLRSAGDVPVTNKALFAFVARRSGSANDNQCHVFCELESTQPAVAITSFANKVIPGIGQTVARNI